MLWDLFWAVDRLTPCNVHIIPYSGFLCKWYEY